MPEPERTEDYVPGDVPPSPADAPGRVVAGRFRLVRPIGEGGMGVVWEAEQTEPVRRPVALKLIRAERGASATILARFEAERQAIALMEHPHIAKLLDAGTAADGSPYFAMELVRGVPLTEYCDAHRLGIADRLRLFVKVCSAVQHAHQKGVIHRDLKPTNILVEAHDGQPVPKVIDFGLAKATNGLALTDDPLLTAFGAVLGTPLYMAPEQAAPDAADVDTRSDVYALGVVLYELLTGSTPLTREAVRKAALDEFLRLVRERESPPPSSRLSAADDAPGVAANRNTEPAKLQRLLKGELDWIVLKALSKERERRYDTATGFARDVERFLNHEPVAAGPPTAGYRLRKFVRRNRGPVVAAGLVAAALVAGLVGTALGLLEARRQERAARGEAEQKEIARQRAVAGETAARERLDQIARFSRVLAESYRDLHPEMEANGGPSLREQIGRRLEAMAKEVNETAIGDPRMTAHVQLTLAEAMRSLGYTEKGLVLAEAALELNRRDLGPAHADTLKAATHWIMLRSHAAGVDRGRKAAATRDAEAVLAAAEATLGPRHPTTRDLRGAIAHLHATGPDPAKGVAAFAELREEVEAEHGKDHSDTVAATYNLAAAHLNAGDPAKAIALAEPLLDRPAPLVGTPTEAIGRFDVLLMLANMYGEQKRYDRAIAATEQVHAGRKELLGDLHIDTVRSKQMLGAYLYMSGQHARAIAMGEEVLAAKVKILGADHPEALSQLANHARSNIRFGDRALGLKLARDVHARFKARHGVDHPDAVRELFTLGRRLVLENEPALAEPIWRDLHAAFEAKRSWPAAATKPAVVSMWIDCLIKLGKSDEAGPLMDWLLPVVEAAPPNVESLSRRSLAGRNLIDLKRYPEAERNLLAAYEGLSKLGPALPPDGQALPVEAVDHLIRLYTATGKSEEAAKWRSERERLVAKKK